jgi:hypothetical protein
MLRFSLGVCCLFLLPFSCLAQQKAEPKVPEGVIYEKDVQHGTGGGEPLLMDIARPEKATKAPCIVVIHGGGWRGGHFKAHTPHILEFAKRGYVSATVQYRLVDKGPYPAQIEDVKCAVRHLRANADKYGIDKDRIGAISSCSSPFQKVNAVCSGVSAAQKRRRSTKWLLGGTSSCNKLARGAWAYPPAASPTAPATP